MKANSQTLNRIPVKEGLFTTEHDSIGGPQLVANSCPACGEIFFPKRRICQNCQSPELQEMLLGRRGKIFSFTVVVQRPASSYKGPVPYAFGWVELPEGLRVETLFTGCAPQDLRIGMDVELIIERLHDDPEGREVVCHKFRPALGEAPARD
jgi:uncharacterized OB-fold protein